MYRSLLTGICCLLCFFATAQKWELQARVNTGLFFFSGESAVKEQMIDNYLGNIFSYPYGKRPEISIAAGGNVQRVTKGKWLFGAGIDLQLLRASSNIDTLSVYQDPGPSIILRVDGQSTFKATCIALSPFIGKRLGNISVTAGPEFAFFVSSSEEVKFKSNTGAEGKRKRDELNHPDMDFRVRFALAWQVKRFGLSVNYTKGITNYYEGIIGANPEAYSNMAGIGIAYSIGNKQ